MGQQQGGLAGLPGEGGPPHTLLLPSSCMVLYWGTGGDLYIHRNHKAYWEWGSGGDLYVHRKQRLIGNGGQGGDLYIHRNHKAYWGLGTGGDVYVPQKP